MVKQKIVSSETESQARAALFEQPKGRSLFHLVLESFLIILVVFVLYLCLALLSFNPQDPSWLQTAWQQPVHNLGGESGAWLADTLLFALGVIAYFFPLLLLFFSWRLYYDNKPYHSVDFLTLFLRSLGAFVVLFTSCGLAALNIDDFYHFSSGGIIGSLLTSLLLPYLGFTGTTLGYLAVWAIGMMLLTGCSWLFLAEKLGAGLWVTATTICQWLTAGRSNSVSNDPDYHDASAANNAMMPVDADNSEQMANEQVNAFVAEDVLFSAPSVDEVVPQWRESAPIDLSQSTADSVITAAISEEQTDALVSEQTEQTVDDAIMDNGAVTEYWQTSEQIDIATFDDLHFSRQVEQPTTSTETLLFEPTPVLPLDAYPHIDESPSLTTMPEEIATEPTASASMPEQKQPAMEIDSLIHPLLMRETPSLKKPTTPFPSLSLLAPAPPVVQAVDPAELEKVAQRIEASLANYRVNAKVVGKYPGPVVTRYELELEPGIKAARITVLSRDLARSLSVVSVRVVEVIAGKPYVGLELPNKHRQMVNMREVIEKAQFNQHSPPLAIALGKDIAGQPVIANLAKMPHLLVAGTTGSGKSVGVNSMIISMLLNPAAQDTVKFIMIDPKMLELSIYEGIPQLLTEVVTDMKDAANALNWCVAEMERRYKYMARLGVRNLAGYNEKIDQAAQMKRPIPDPFWKQSESMALSPPDLTKLPYIVVFVDEFADLMMAVGKKIEELIARLAQKARAAGIHLVLATQRPSVDVITGLIKANIPTRIAFTVSSKIDSRTILDQGGAETLLGMGDMLYLAPSSAIPLRVHGAFVSDDDVHAVVQDWQSRGRPQYIEAILADNSEDNQEGNGNMDEPLDELFDQAVAFVAQTQRVSISSVQRKFRIGYNRAARIVEQMEAQGIVSSPATNGNRDVLTPPLE